MISDTGLEFRCSSGESLILRVKARAMSFENVSHMDLNPQAAGPYLTHLPVGRGFSAIP